VCYLLQCCTINVLFIVPTQNITQRIKVKLMRLPMAQKLIGIGSVVVIVSSFLTWYKDVDAFSHGGAYLGVTGPLYLIGYVIVCLSIFSLSLASFYVLDKKIPSLPIKESMAYILVGSISLFLLLIANSIYFHPQFGLNIASKEYGAGMILAFIGSILTIVGGVSQSKESGTSRLIEEFQEEARVSIPDPVEELNNFQKEQEKKNEKLDIDRSALGLTTRARDGGGREYKSKSKMVMAPKNPTTVRMEPYPDVSQITREKEPVVVSAKSEGDGVNPNSVIRMDL